MLKLLTAIAPSVISVAAQAQSPAPPAPTNQTQAPPNDQNVNIKADINAPRVLPAADNRPCLIVAAEEHRITSGSGIIGLAVLAASKGYWAYRDSYNSLSPSLIKIKYSGKDIMSLQKQGIHVIVIDRNSKEVTNARLACQGYTPEQ